MFKKTVLISIFLVMMLVVSLNVMAYDLGTYDLEGETVTYVHWLDMFSEDDYDLLERKEEAEEIFNVNIEHEMVPWGDYPEVIMSRLLAGDSEYDIWYTTASTHWGYVSEGTLYPVGEILPPEFYEQFQKPNFMPDEYQGQNFVISDPSPQVGRDIIYLAWNKELFAEQGLTNLYELYEQGTEAWTWDAMEEIMREATIVEEGEVTQVGLVELMGSRGISLLFTNGGKYFTEDENGNIEMTLNNERGREYIEYAHRWVTEEEIARPWDQEWFFNGNAAMFIAPLHEIQVFAEEGRNVDFEYGIVPLPVGPSYEGDEFVVPGTNWMAPVLPANSEKPEALTALNDFLFNQRYTEEEEEELFQESLMEWVHDEKSFEIAVNHRWTGEVTRFYQFHVDLQPSLIWEAQWPIIAGDADMDVLDEIKPAIDAAIEDFMN